jgi:hypothetical protein
MPQIADLYVEDASGNRFTVLRSKPSFVMCDRCLETVAIDAIEKHTCDDWWNKPIDYGDYDAT